MFQRNKRWKYSIVISRFLLNVEIWFNFTTSNLLLVQKNFFFYIFPLWLKYIFGSRQKILPLLYWKLKIFVIGNIFQTIVNSRYFFNHLFFWCSIFFNFIPLFLHINSATRTWNLFICHVLFNIIWFIEWITLNLNDTIMQLLVILRLENFEELLQKEILSKFEVLNC